jgi:hypothetical protein
MVQLDVASEDAVGGERRQAAPQPFKLGCVDAAADAAGEDQLSVQTVIGGKLRAEIRAASYQIGPADHDKFLAVQKFDLAQQAAIAARISAFGDDALETLFASALMKRAPLPDLMVL